MRQRRPVWMIPLAAMLGVALLAAAPSGAVVPVVEPDPATPAAQIIQALADTTGPQQPPADPPQGREPGDRYDLAGGCWAVQSAASGGFVRRDGGGFAATADAAGAEPFHFQATDLGRYLLYGSAQDFVAASDSPLGTAADAATGSGPGGIAEGASIGATGVAARAVGDGAAADATGRGAAVVSAAAPSELADWDVDEHGNGFRITLPAAGKALAAGGDGRLVLVDAADKGKATRFAFTRTQGCATFPEVEIGVDGPVAIGASPTGEVRGFLDAHLHMMAFEFLGGRARCGRPWHRYGVTYALVDCPDHEPGGAGAVLENVLAGGDVPVHDTVGWPTFGYWPRYDSLTHEQVYYKWLERSWRGGLRMFVNLLVDNNVLCEIYPYKSHGCNEMDGVRLQAQRIRELERYIDAQSGGPGEGWFRIVTDPFEARRVMNAGKLAVVLGIEVSVLFDCGVFAEQARCDHAQIDKQLDEVHALGVRQMEFVNKFDNALAGVAGDAGSTGIVVNNGNFIETGKFWQMETCTEADGHAHDRQQHNFHDDSGSPDELTGRDALAGGILRLTGTSGAAPVYPEGPHCNVRGLTHLGEYLIRKMVQKGMIFDPDHMSARARTQAMDIVEELGYPGVVSSHGWADETTYPRIYRQGGVVTPYGGSSTSFVANWRQHKQWADPRWYWGFGYGADTNGFGSQGAPRGAGAENKVTYPFTGFGGVTVHRQRSGERVYDINTDGVAHYGLYPDWIEDLRKLAGDEIVEDLARGPEAYLQMWERALGIAPDGCAAAQTAGRADSRVRRGMTPEQVLLALGQPEQRGARSFSYCAGKVVVAFDDTGRVSAVRR
ncbi:MAG TPA: hypothetical protein VNU01_06470 [Egibacteraceae bacterium]|nr:hypothetical protein [Egibacteraceae bacterium]